jgi:antitoxin component of RelBE/YafQ-DinJ toxin-antitoxin module
VTSTPIRTVRINDALWHAAQDRAARSGTTVSAVIRDLLADWAADLRPIEPKE